MARGTLARWELGTNTAAELVELSAEEWLPALKWRKDAPPDLVAAAKAGAPLPFLKQWLEQYPPGSIPDGSSGQWTSLWSLDAWPTASPLAALFSSASVTTNGKASRASRQNTLRSQLRAWWDAGGETAAWTPLETLLILEAWPLIVTGRDAVWALDVWKRLLFAATESTHWPTGRFSFENSSSEQRLLALGELPWRLGAFFAPLKGSEKLRKQGADRLEHELVEETDENGVPLAELLPRLPQWLPSLIRSVTASQQTGLRLWDRDSAELWQSTVEHIAPLILRDGQFVFSRVGDDSFTAHPWLEPLLLQSGWSDGPAALQSLLGSSRKRSSSKISSANSKTPRQRPQPAICLAPVGQSDTASWSILRTDWSARSDLAVVAHVGLEPALFLQALGEPLLEGMWRSRVLSAGEETPVAGNWSCVCWQTDPVGDYCELQTKIAGGGRVERQIFLSREHQFCILSDVLSDFPADRFDYEIRWPLVPGWTAIPEATNRALRLQKGTTTVRVYPLSLPTYFNDSTPDLFDVANGAIRLNHCAAGTGWYGPLILDWAPSRHSAPAFWKSLLVTEEGRVVRADHGSSYRLKVGNYQWLLYRGMHRGYEPRAFLGHQTHYETVIGRVESNGDVTPLMLVE